MSFEGKLMRGLKWYQFRDKNGNYPKGILETEKVNDLNFYLEFVKGKDEAKVIELLKKLSLMARSRKKRLPIYKETLDALNSVGSPEVTKKKGGK